MLSQYILLTVLKSNSVACITIDTSLTTGSSHGWGSGDKEQIQPGLELITDGPIKSLLVFYAVSVPGRQLGSKKVAGYLCLYMHGREIAHIPSNS